MLASVVIACFNHAEFIEQCLHSVFNQSYLEIELIIVDDCSIDQSYTVIKALCASPAFINRFVKIFTIRNPINIGAANSWNRAISHSRGKMIFLLNSDDFFSENRVECFMIAGRERGMFFAFSSVKFIDKFSRQSFGYNAKRLDALSSKSITTTPYLSWAMLEAQVGISTGNFVFTADLWKRVGPFRNFRYCHDWDFALRSIVICEPIKLNDCFYAYRIHDTNSFHSLSDVAVQETAACIRKYAMLIISETSNKYCLAPVNYGSSFDALLEYTPSFKYWWAYFFSPYKKEHRTIDSSFYIDSSE